MLKKFAATTSTAALAIGMLAAGAGVAAAQEEEPSTGSMSSGSLGLDLEKTAADLELANQALNGPVDVTPGEEGTVVSYTNEGEEAQKCGGMVFPYASIADESFNMDEAINLVTPIAEAGNVTVLSQGDDGEPTSVAVGDDDNLFSMLLPFTGLDLPSVEPGGVNVEAGDKVEWTVTNENGPFATAILCGSLDDIKFGVDKQVVADQINDKIPGGSVAPVGPGSISGGSVELGATALGSLAGGDDESEEPTDPEE